MNSLETDTDWDERASAREQPLRQTDTVFGSLFERSVDAVWLLDPQAGVFVDCNEAAVKLIGAKSKQELLRMRPDELSPPLQPDGTNSSDKSAEIIATIQREKSLRFEWLMRRRDGRDVPIEVSGTAVPMDGKTFNVIISRDISERKNAERELRELTQALDCRVTEPTTELSASEARFRALVEHAPEAIVVYGVEAERFLFGNEHACDLYGVSMEKLPQLTPADVSPEFQPCGRRTSDLVHEKIMEVLAGGIAIFEWVHQRADGRLVPTEVRLLRLPAEGQTLIRASIIDNTERKRAERALRESEAKFRALFEGASQGVVLHDERQILEVNPAAVRILRRRFAYEILGKHPGEFSPSLQPNGESSEEMARKYIEECMTRGSARFDWLACDPNGCEIPMEVMLTRIEWSGREVIQAFITDITERQRAQAALAESEARFSAAFHASPALIGILRVSDGKYVLANDAHLNWLGFGREEVLGRTCLELGMWENPGERDCLLKEVAASGSVRQRECSWRNRDGERFTVLLSAETIQLNETPHMLVMALDISQRKRAEEELKASEARLRESEARFSAAFQASPVFIQILGMSDGAYVLVNDAFVNWVGYPREEIIGHTSVEFGMWENSEDRDSALNDMRGIGSIRQREVRWRNRRGECLTILLSAETIILNNTPHILSFAQDITQRKQAEVETVKALAREKELNQLKSNFVSMVSHEFRTPLGIIQSSAELLREFHERMQPDERAEQLTSIAKNTRRMAGMMEEILVLSRLDSGKLEFRPSSLDLESFCRRVVDEVLSATQRRCAIELSVAFALPRADADERLLGHIFTNLLSNAIKYSENGASVQFNVYRQGVDAVCVICDGGIGIAEIDQTRLFTAFHRGANVGNRSGTGLGLVLVKRCVELHRGQVQLRSALAKGTTVTIRLPVFESTS
jgi:PAS domain S-box-containing protein